MFNLKLQDIKDAGNYAAYDPKTGETYLVNFCAYDDPDEPAAFGQLFAYEGSSSTPKEEFNQYLFMKYTDYDLKNLYFKFNPYP